MKGILGRLFGNRSVPATAVAERTVKGEQEAKGEEKSARGGSQNNATPGIDITLTSSEGPQTYVIKEDYPCSEVQDMPFAVLNPIQSAFRTLYNHLHHCVVESATGTGKSVIIYIAARFFLDQGLRVVLMAPTKALVKELYKEACGIWGGKIVGLNTGEDRSVAGKFFVVSTPEGFISAVRGGKEWAKAGLLIIDEAHNILDPSRGAALDVAMTVQVADGGRVLLLSGTFPNKRELADLLGADLFISEYRKTKITVEEVDAPDDMDVALAKVTPPKGKKGYTEAEKRTGATFLEKDTPGTIETMSGYAYNGKSVRLHKLRGILNQHQEESVIVFVPTKAQGFCLSESLVCGFHCADLEEDDKVRLVAEFQAGVKRLLLATNTLSQGVNTPADVVVVCGARRGSSYLDASEVAQCFGRAGRGKSHAKVYIIGDPIELFNAKKIGFAKSLPLPVESMILTVLSWGYKSHEEIMVMLGRTYAASLTAPDKVGEAVDRYLHFLKACNILREKDGLYSLTQEGALLARYYISPRQYIGCMKAARRLLAAEIPETAAKEPQGTEEKGEQAESPPGTPPEQPCKLTDVEKGCLLLTLVMPNLIGECPPRLEKDFQMALIPLELDNEISAKKAGLVMQYIQRPLSMPPFFPYQMRDADRWLSMLADMEKYGGEKGGKPGRAWLHAVLIELKKSAAKMQAKQKKTAPVQQSLY